MHKCYYTETTLGFLHGTDNSGPEEANLGWLGQYSHYVEMTGSKCGTAMIV